MEPNKIPNEVRQDKWLNNNKNKIKIKQIKIKKSFYWIGENKWLNNNKKIK